MKKLISALLALILFSNTAFADCDWSKIKKNADSTYTYSEELNRCVGQLVQDAKIKDQQVQDLTKSISLKDLAIKDSDTRANTWSETSRQLEDRLQKIDSSQKTTEWIAFGLGLLTAIGTGMALSRLYK